MNWVLHRHDPTHDSGDVAQTLICRNQSGGSPSVSNERSSRAARSRSLTGELVQCFALSSTYGPRLCLRGGVANPRDTSGYRCGSRLATKANPLAHKRRTVRNTALEHPFVRCVVVEGVAATFNQGHDVLHEGAIVRLAYRQSSVDGATCIGLAIP